MFKKKFIPKYQSGGSIRPERRVDSALNLLGQIQRKRKPSNTSTNRFEFDREAYNPTQDFISHPVERGENVSTIYDRYGLNYFNHKNIFRKLNPNIDPNKINVGDVIRVAPNSYVEGWENVIDGVGRQQAALFNALQVEDPNVASEETSAQRTERLKQRKRILDMIKNTDKNDSIFRARNR